MLGLLHSCIVFVQHNLMSHLIGLFSILNCNKTIIKLLQSFIIAIDRYHLIFYLISMHRACLE